MAITVIPTIEIDKIEFKELVVDLLDDFVHGDASPFKDVKSVLEDYLDGAQDLDATQKAGIFADWLKEAYSDINKQAMSTALDLLKTNSSFELERYAAQSGYNLQLAQEEKVRAEILILGKDDLLKEKEIDALEQEILNKKVAYMEAMGRVHKQYGYANAGLNATLDLAMGASTVDGALDEQVAGYDILHMKDILKTMDEKAALMQNAKIPETLEEKKARVELMYEISGLTYSIADGSNVYTFVPNPDETRFNGTWTS